MTPHRGRSLNGAQPPSDLASPSTHALLCAACRERRPNRTVSSLADKCRCTCSAGTRRKPHTSTSETSRAHILCRRAGPRQFARSPTRERRWPAGNSAPQGPTPAAGRPGRRRTPSNSVGCRAQRASRPAAPAAPYIAVHSARRRHISAGQHISAANDDVSPRAQMEIRAPESFPRQNGTQAGGRRRNRCGPLEDKVRI